MPPVFLPQEQKNEHDRDADRTEKRRRGWPPGRNLIERQHGKRQRGREQETAAPVKTLVSILLICYWQPQPAEDDRQQPKGDIDPEHPRPAQCPQEQAADNRASADPDRLRSSVHAERPRAQAFVRGRHDKRHAVGPKHRPAKALQEPKRDQRREMRRKAAERTRSGEDHKADDVEQFPAEDLAELGEYRQERRDAEQIGERDPAHALQRAVEYASQGRQRELHDARVDLAHERADACHADDPPRIRGPAGEERDRRRLRPMADEVADTKSRRRAQTVGAHPPPRPNSGTGSGHMDAGPARKSSARSGRSPRGPRPGLWLSKSPALIRLFADGVVEESSHARSTRRGKPM